MQLFVSRIVGAYSELEGGFDGRADRRDDRHRERWQAPLRGLRAREPCVRPGGRRGQGQARHRPLAVGREQRRNAGDGGGLGAMSAVLLEEIAEEILSSLYDDIDQNADLRTVLTHLARNLI